jgi:hypothetical protein
MTAEIWGYCPDCRRWFYCDGWFRRDLPAPTCPVCGMEPTAIENRAGGVVVVDDLPAGLVG